MTAKEIITYMESLHNDEQRDEIVTMYLQYAEQANNWY